MTSKNELISKIAGSETEALLVQHGTSISAASFQIGYITLERVVDRITTLSGSDISADEKYALAKLTNQDIYSWVALRIGKSARSVERYVRVSRQFSPDVVEKFWPLTFSHFEASLQFGAKWKDVLNYALDVFASTGRYPSVDEMTSKFQPDNIPSDMGEGETQAESSEQPVVVASVSVMAKGLCNELRRFFALVADLLDGAQRESLMVIIREFEELVGEIK
jgi:hypothetical protein